MLQYDEALGGVFAAGVGVGAAVAEDIELRAMSGAYCTANAAFPRGCTTRTPSPDTTARDSTDQPSLIRSRAQVLRQRYLPPDSQLAVVAEETSDCVNDLISACIGLHLDPERAS